MRRYTVYRVRHSTRKREVIGCIVDRRRTEREMRQDFFALLSEARELFGEGQGGRIEIVLQSPPAAARDKRAVAQELAPVG